MASFTEAVALLGELRVTTRLGQDVTPELQREQVKVYAKRLSAFDVRDVAEAVRGWPTEFWPAWSLLLAAVDDAALRRRQAEAGRAQGPRRGENFVERCLRLGFHAGRLSNIGATHWTPVADLDRQHPLSDDGVSAALRWCEDNPGRSWRAPVPKATAEDVRRTARLVQDMRQRPEAYPGGNWRDLVAIGEDRLRRHIATGAAPPDVVRDFPHLLDREEEAA